MMAIRKFGYSQIQCIGLIGSSKKCISRRCRPLRLPVDQRWSPVVDPAIFHIIAGKDRAGADPASDYGGSVITLARENGCSQTRVVFSMLYCIREAGWAQCLTLRTSQPVVGRHSPVFDRPILYLMCSSGAAAVVDSAALSHIVLTICSQTHAMLHVLYVAYLYAWS